MRNTVDRKIRLFTAACLVFLSQALLGCSGQGLQNPVMSHDPRGITETAQLNQTLTDLLMIPPKEQFVYENLITSLYVSKDVSQALREGVLSVYSNRFGKNTPLPTDIEMYIYLHKQENLFTYYYVHGKDNKLHAVYLDIPRQGDNVDFLRAVISSSDVVLTDLERFIITKEPGEERKPDILFTAGKNARGEFVIVQQEEYAPGTWSIVEQAAQKGSKEFADAMAEYLIGFRVFDFAHGPQKQIPFDPKKPKGLQLLVPDRWYPEIILIPTRKTG